MQTLEQTPFKTSDVIETPQVTSRCIMSTGIDCIDFSISDSKIQMALKNKLGTNIIDVALRVTGCEDTKMMDLFKQDKWGPFTFDCELGPKGSILKKDVKLNYTSKTSGLDYINKQEILAEIK